MNVKRFTAKNSRDALALVRQALGDDAVVLSTRPGADGVEVLAMAPEGMQQIEHAAASAQLVRAPRAEGAVPAARGARAPAPSFQQRAARERKEPQTDAPRVEPRTTAPADANVERDVQTLGMSTLTFQDYVRERMLKRREQELGRDTEPAARTAAARDDRAAAPRRVDPSSRRRRRAARSLCCAKNCAWPSPTPSAWTRPRSASVPRCWVSCAR